MGHENWVLASGGVCRSELAGVFSRATVAEYQRRGVVHFHAVIRLDGPAGPATAPPAWATLGLLTAAIDHAIRIVNVVTPAATGVAARTLAWGREHDTRPITTTGELTDCRR